MFPIMRFKIEDRSMEPTFKQGDFVIVNKLSYAFTKPEKNDVIVFKHPKEKDRFLIKRVSMITNSEEIYVLGENKNYSQDSRHFGPVKREYVVGKVWIHFKK